jgi:ABC-type glycerol-3-phosphate transport system substrate-binding protein
MQKKFAGFFVLVIVLALVLAACASPGGVTTGASSATPAAGTTPATAAAPAAGEGGVINVWTDGDTNISDWLTNKVAPAFEKAYP